MNHTVHAVCGECLQSVELFVDDPTSDSSTCPACGGTVDGLLTRNGANGEPGVDARLPLDLPCALKTPRELAKEKSSFGTLSRYQLRELLGDGGFGQVFRAYDPWLDREVALKFLKTSDPGERIMERFFREARAAARLRHPNIVGLFDAGVENGRCWIAYEFIKGSTLASQRGAEKMDLETAVRITRQLAVALDYAHGEGILHRDLKPSNVLIDERGRPRLTDFGLARRSDLDSDLTRDGAILGTPAYMSPEQAAGRSKLADERSDVYSLGVILFELLCGRRPSNGPSASPLWTAQPPPGPTTDPGPFDRSVPRELRRICMKALADVPSDRHPDAGALADDLGRWLNHGRANELRRLPPGFLLAGAALSISVVALWASLPRGASLNTPTLPRNAASVGGAPAPVSAPAAAVGPDAPVSLIGNRKTKTYHRSHCPSLHTTSPQNLLKLPDVAAAQSLLFVPCVICLPPTADPGPAAAGQVSRPPE